MELHAVHGQLAMREAHDQPVLGFGADRKVGRAGLARRPAALIASRRLLRVGVETRRPAHGARERLIGRVLVEVVAALIFSARR